MCHRIAVTATYNCPSNRSPEFPYTPVRESQNLSAETILPPARKDCAASNRRFPDKRRAYRRFQNKKFGCVRGIGRRCYEHGCIAQPAQPGYQCALSPHDEIDLYTGAGSAVKRLDERRIHHRIDLHDDACGLSTTSVAGLAV